MPTPKDDNLIVRDLCFVDVETTGSVFGFHEIIDVAAVRTSTDGSIIRTTWAKRIRPKYPERISPEARYLNQFNQDLWTSAEESSPQLWSEFVELAKDCIPICHNPSFDRAFITLACNEYGIRDLGLDYHWIGTESLAWPLYKQGIIPGLSLESLCAFFGLEIEPRPHTALNGAYACMKVYGPLIEVISTSVAKTSGKKFKRGIIRQA